MDFRVKVGKLRLVRPEEGMRAVSRHAPQAQELAERCAAGIAPHWRRIYAFRRRIATIAMGTLACLLLLHVVFGANGMVVYQQKHAEVRELRLKTEKIRQENEALAEENTDLSSENSKAVEREARGHLHYAKPGEVVYVPTQAQNPQPHPDVHTAKK